MAQTDKGPIAVSYFYEKAWQPARRRLDGLARAAAAFERGDDIGARGHLSPFTRRRCGGARTPGS